MKNICVSFNIMHKNLVYCHSNTQPKHGVTGERTDLRVKENTHAIA